MVVYHFSFVHLSFFCVLSCSFAAVSYHFQANFSPFCFYSVILLLICYHFDLYILYFCIVMMFFPFVMTFFLLFCFFYLCSDIIECPLSFFKILIKSLLT